MKKYLLITISFIVTIGVLQWFDHVRAQTIEPLTVPIVLGAIEEDIFGATSVVRQWVYTRGNGLLRPINNVDVVVIGDTATTTTDSVFEVKGHTQFRGGFTATSTATTTPTFHSDEFCLQNDCKTTWGAVGSLAGTWEQIFSSPVAITPTTSGAGLFVTGSSTFNSVLRVNDTFRAGEDIIVGGNASNDIDTIFFDDGVTEYLRWNDSQDRFEFSNDLKVQGLLTSENVTTTNIEVIGSSTTTRYANFGVVDSSNIGFDNGDVNVGDDLVVDDDAWIDGNLVVGGNQTTTGESVVGTKNIGDYFDFYNGTILESFNATSTSNGTIITAHLENASNVSGDLTLRFSSGDVVISAPTSTTLTEGSDASPTENFLYITEANQFLEISTSDWPHNEEHIKVAYYLIPSASFVQSNGAYINQNWNDHAAATDDQGHLSDIGEKLRLCGGCYHDGVDGNGDSGTYIDRTDATPDTVYIKTTSGTIFQMHRHTYTAKDTSGSDVFLIPNSSVAAYESGSDLYDFLVDADGDSMTGNYYNLALWGVGNKTGEFDPLMINLPTCSYNNQTSAENDVDKCDVLTIPRQFNRESSNGFLIARLTMKHTNGGQNLELISTVDLRGTIPATAAGGTGGSALVNFPDNQFTIFDETDTTKIIAFDVGTNVTTGNTRTIKLQDQDGTMALLESTQTFTGDNTFSGSTNASTTNVDNLFAFASSTIAANATVTGSFMASDLLFVKPDYDGVGIATTTPRARLHVTESTAGVITTFSNTSNNYGALFLRTDNITDSGARNWGFFADANAFGNLTIAPSIDNTGDPSFSSNGLTVTSGGFLGVATTTPWGQLSVEGQAAGPSFVVSDTSNNTDFLIDVNGNVGIGTTDIGALLHVNGDARITTVNATTTVTDNLVVGSDAAITDITGAGLTISSGALTVDSTAVEGINGAWEEFQANILRPTNTTAAILVNAASSTITELITNHATSTVAAWIGSGGVANNLNLQGGDLYVQDDLEVDGTIFGNVTGDLTGNADTATALAANGANCSAGSYALGVDASGAAEGCTDATTEIDSAIATHAGIATAHQALVTLAGTPNYLTLSGQEITLTVLDVSDDTNLAVTAPIVLTDDTISIDQTANFVWTGLHVFNSASTTFTGGVTIGGIATTSQLVVGPDINGAPTSTATINGTLNVIGATQFNSISYTWPDTDGTANQVLHTNGSGILSWGDDDSGGGGGGAAWEATTTAGFMNPTISPTTTGAGLVWNGKSTTTGDMVIDTGAPTSTLIIGSSSTALVGGCLAIFDEDKLGFTFCKALNGTLSCSTTDCSQ